MRRSALSLAMAALLVCATAPLSPAGAHSERPGAFPARTGSVPVYRTTGPALVVCKPDSLARTAGYPAALRDLNRRLWGKCVYRDIQAAVNAATNGSRILIMPGVYKELPSRARPHADPACADLFIESPDGAQAYSYAYHLRCPNDANLIAILGDRDDDGVCDAKCNLQVEGTGASPRDVQVTGNYHKENVVRADRANGVYFRNFLVRNASENALYIMETDGFVIDRMIGADSDYYGFLTFLTDHGLYTDCEAYNNGDSGIYPGSASDHHWNTPGGSNRWAVEIRNCNSHHNALGYSGTAGNSVWAHHNRFHHNTTGLATDSLYPRHPGLPQDAATFENNVFYSNNYDLHDDVHDQECVKPRSERADKRMVCPTVPVPTGTGLLIAGGNWNRIRNNRFYDNWRYGVILIGVPAALRDEPDKGFDTSHFNRYEGNVFGSRPDGAARPNGLDIWWDEQGAGNCWQNNSGIGGTPTADPPIGGPLPPPKSLPDCDDPYPPFDEDSGLGGWPNGSKSLFIASCATWSQENRNPPGCDWFDPPTRPGTTSLTTPTGSPFGDSWNEVLVTAAAAIAASLSKVGASRI